MTNETIPLNKAPRPAGGRPSRADVLAWALLAFGVVVRLREWMAGRSLWADEASLSISLIERDLGGLLRPLDFAQLAPPGYLWIVKGIITFTGPGELPLRSFAMLAGIGLTVVGWWVARRLFGPWPAVAAAAMLALSPGAIYHSNEAKPYSSDALVAATLLLAGVWSIGRELTWRRLAVLALLGAVAVWVSFPAPFTLVGLGLALALPLLRRRDWSALSRVAAACAVWAGSWGVVYVLATRQAATMNYMEQYWQDQFLSLAGPFHAANGLVIALDTASLPFGSPIGPWGGAERITALMLVLLASGAWALASRQMVPSLCLLLSGLLTPLMAALAHLYPLEGRLLQFTLPSLVVLASGGISLLISKGVSRVASLIVAVTLIWSCLVDLETLRRPAEREDALSLLGALVSEAAPGDAVYVWPGRGAAVDFYYRTRPSLWPAGVQAIWAPRHSTGDAVLKELGGLCGRPRVWLTAAHLSGLSYRQVLAVLQARSEIVSSRKFEGAELTLLDLRNLPCQQSAAGP